MENLLKELFVFRVVWQNANLPEIMLGRGYCCYTDCRYAVSTAWLMLCLVFNSESAAEVFLTGNCSHVFVRVCR